MISTAALARRWSEVWSRLEKHLLSSHLLGPLLKNGNQPNKGIESQQCQLHPSKLLLAETKEPKSKALEPMKQ